jgi:sporulation-control protein spo0M
MYNQLTSTSVMKKLFATFALAALMLFAVGTNDAQAQSQQRTNVGQLVSGLINVNVGAVAVNIGDITLEDLVDVQDVLNNNNIEALNNVLNNSPIASNNSEILTNLLRDADILTDAQVVVGVLSGGLFVIQ